MLTKEQLYVQDIMPEWADISLALYKEFSEDCLFPKTFRYYLENQFTIDVQFKEWAMKHLWSIHHINSRIDKNKLFEAIDNGLCVSDFRQTAAMRKRLNDNKDRIRMFACVYQIMKMGTVFYVEEGKLSGTNIRIDYIKSKSINGKGVHLGMRYEEGVYVPLTLLIDRAINPAKTVEGLKRINVQKLEIIENEKIIDIVEFKTAHEISRKYI